MIIEICATSLESIKNAQNAGAHRIELCEKHSIGGITPSKEFLIRAFEIIKIPTNVLIRPRGGNFIFSDREIEIMIEQINFFKTFKINGFVIGFINNNNRLDKHILNEFRKITDGYELTFHRAFDFLDNPQESIELLIENRYDRILCSGNNKSAVEGLENLRKFNKISNGRIIIMPGGGINLNNFKDFKDSSFSEIHLSAINYLNSPHSDFNIIKEIVESSNQ